MTDYAAALLDLVEGRLEPAAFASRFGGGGSPPEALAFYREMVRRQRRLILDGFYAATRRISGRLAVGRWDDVASRFVRERPPRHPNPSLWALTFDTFLEETGELDAPVLRELVDFARARYRVLHVPHAPHVRLDHDVLVRLYDHDVEGITRAVDRNDGVDDVALTVVPKRPLVITRSRTTGHLIVRTATLATLVALQPPPEPGAPLPPGLSAEVLREEEARLVRAGILPGTP